MNKRDQALGQELAFYRVCCEAKRQTTAKDQDQKWEDLLRWINEVDHQAKHTAALLDSVGDSLRLHMKEPEHILRARYREQQRNVLIALLNEGLTPKEIRAKYGVRDWTLKQIEALEARGGERT